IGAAGGWLLLERLRLRTVPQPSEEPGGTGALWAPEPARHDQRRARPRVEPDPAPTQLAVQPLPSTPDVEAAVKTEPAQGKVAHPEAPAAKGEEPAEPEPEAPPAAKGPEVVAQPSNSGEPSNIDELISYLQATKAEADARVAGKPPPPPVAPTP